MVKINDTTTFPNTAPAVGDHVLGTDVSDTGNSADGEVVTFLFSDIGPLLADNYSGWRFVESLTSSGGLFTPTAFEAGFEYRFVCANLAPDGGTTRFLYIQVQKASDDSWVGSGASGSDSVFTATDLTSSTKINAIIEVLDPDVSADTHIIKYKSSQASYIAGSDGFTTSMSDNIDAVVSVGFTSATTIKNVRIGSSSSGFASGATFRVYKRAVSHA